MLFLAPISISLTITFVGFVFNAKEGGAVTTNSALSSLSGQEERISKTQR